MNADGRRLSPEPNPSIAPPGMSFDDGTENNDGLWTEAAERKIFATTTLLHDCSTDYTDSEERQR
jgi:hypothetical protein